MHPGKTHGMVTLLSRKSVLAGLLLFFTLIAYLPAIQGGFIWDDDSYVTENQTLRSLEGLSKIWVEPNSSPQYYPLVFSTFWLEHKLWGLNPTGYHLVNVFLHALSVLLLYRLLVYLNVPGAWLAAAVFALHPVHVESVAWVAERKNVLSGFFYFSSAFCLFHFFGLAGEREKKLNLWWYTSGLLLFACALLSKTVTSTLPAAMLLVLWWKRGGVKGREVAALAPFFTLGLTMGLATAWLEKHHVGAVGSEWDLSLMDRFLIAGRALWFYLGKLVWPRELIFNYPRWQVDASIWWQYLYPMGVVLVVIVLWLFRKRLGRGPLVGVLFFCGTLFPALGFLDVYPFRYSYVADHFQYLASVGLIVLLVALVSKAVSRWDRRITSLLALIVLLLLGWQTWHQGYVYKDVKTLWSDTIEKNPLSWMAHNNLGAVLADEGRLEEALSHYLKALQLNSTHPEIHNNLGNALAKLGKFRQAETHYLQALQTNPDYVKAHSNLGNLLATQGRLDEAMKHFSEALRLRPDYAEAHINLGNVLASQGKFDEAINHYSEALRLKPDSAQAHYNLGNTFAFMGRLEEAIAHYSEALRIKPDYVAARKNLELVLQIKNKVPSKGDNQARQ
ncbi:MAG: tetratricopeptide repeat protein [Deltaproteobacteria bacterium]|nr:tetratricopeptide repeat protein [Deltaproteobacteria bacterium]